MAISHTTYSPTAIMQLFLTLLLATAAVSASLVFACATPFAAFAVLSAATLPVGPALMTIAAAWVINQAIGFGLLAYPRELNTILWGLAIAIAAGIATVAASYVFDRLKRRNQLLSFSVALIASYMVYELCLWGAAFILGGTEAFRAQIVVWLALLNALWLAALAIVWEAGKRARFVTRTHLGQVTS